jgi:4-methyl-5(b-hydroxyethyl)-thiazole monophosphate biosynthesis
MKNVLIVATDGMEDMEIAPLIEIPGWTKVVEGVEQINVKIAGWDSPVKMMHGTKIVPDLKMDQVKVDDFDAIVIPGGWPGTKFFDLTYGEKFQKFLHEADKKQKLLVTLCFGILPVGNAGLLKGKRSAIFTSNTPFMCQEFKNKLVGMGAVYTDAAIHHEGHIISNIGPAVANEVAFQMVEKLIGAESAAKIQDMMMWKNVCPKDLKWTGAVAKK